ncbi:hypothetical protein AVEN_230762-1 [Araneus ventricosus]|uniref:Endonuclease/exonuclease/phosphatase domain-containing protein n=2 Tax=Araneus ventricosus TaxID=182803 RepID=A0A4Y2A1Z5_ARAVE|nr:hypothetical protein AVEN_230762-1 [Araneus ventricosus]
MFLIAAQQHQPDLFIVQEPHVKDGKIAGIPKCWKSWLSKSGKAGIIALPTFSTPVVLTAKENTMAITITKNSKAFTIISSYSSPYANFREILEEQTDLTTDINGEEYLIGGDFNAHSQRWGYRDEDSRGKQLQEFIAEKHIFLLNSSDSPPTYEHNNRQGWPDLTMVSSHSLAAICEWDVLEEETYNDHKFVKICINSNISSLSFARFKTAHGGHCKFVNLFKSKVQALRNPISNSCNEEEFNETTRTIQLEIYKPCKQVYKIKRNPLIQNVTWWNRDLQIKKQELKALARRLQKSRGEDRIHYKIVLSKKRALLKKAVKRAQRGSWRLLCTQTQTPYGTPYRSALKAYKPPSDTFQIMENSERGTPTESGLKILQKLYPKIAPRAAQIQPHQTLLEEEKFSQQEIDDILKNIPNGKAPGYNAIDNIIVKVIFNSFPCLLLDFFNKCLELKCFPDPLKIGLVILFHKTGKEEQNIKFYRPIYLLPTLGKLLEKLLRQRFNFQ